MRAQNSFLLIAAAALATTTLSCADSSTSPPIVVDLDAFAEMAAGPLGRCGDRRSQLHLIDGQFVFWAREGTCADGSFQYILFDQVPSHRLCRYEETIAGPVRECPPGPGADIFEIAVANLDDPDLGLGPGHTVEPIPF